jgi:hypothetical protein
MARRDLLKALPLVVPIIIAAASVGPEQATSNLSKWVAWSGANQIPRWLLLTILGAVSIAYVTAIWGIPYLYKRMRAKSAVPLASPHPDLKLKDAVSKILGNATVLGPGEAHVGAAFDLLDDLSQEAAFGTLRVWGRLKRTNIDDLMGIVIPLTEIPQAHWTNYRIDEMAYMRDESGQTRGIVDYDDNPYSDLTFLRSEIDSFASRRKSKTAAT